MKLNLGALHISISKQAPAPEKKALAIAHGGAISPMTFNRYDDPQRNILYIRETVAAAMHARSEAIGRGRLHAFERKKGTHERTALAPEHPLEQMLQAPNPLLGGFDLLELISQWLDATGNALLLKVRNALGVPTELWLLPATSFVIERGANELPEFYRFQPANTRIAASDIIHIKRPDIRTSPFYGHALISDMIETAKTDSALRFYQQRFFDNDAMPRAVLRFPEGASLTQLQIDEIRTAWEAKYQSPANAGKLAILPDGGVLEAIGGGAKELDFAKSRSELRDTIREAFKVPKIVLGDTDAVNLANAETSYRVFMRDVVDYALGKITAALTRELATEFSANIVIEHEPVVPESEEQLLGRLRELRSALTIDEQRALLKLPPLPHGNGKVFLIGNAVLGSDWKPLGG